MDSVTAGVSEKGGGGTGGGGRGAVMVSNSRKRIQHENFQRFKDPPLTASSQVFFYCRYVVLHQGFNNPHFTPGLDTRLHDRGKSSRKQPIFSQRLSVVKTMFNDAMMVMLRQRHLVYEYDDDDDDDEQVQLSRYTAWLRVQRTKFDSRQGYEFCLFETTSRPAPGPIRPSISWFPEAHFQGVKWTVREASHSVYC